MRNHVTVILLVIVMKKKKKEKIRIIIIYFRNKHQVPVKSLFCYIAFIYKNKKKNRIQNFGYLLLSVLLYVLSRFLLSFFLFVPSLGSDIGKENRINLVWLKSSFPLLSLVAHTDTTCSAQRAGDTQRERERDTGEGRRAGK